MFSRVHSSGLLGVTTRSARYQIHAVGRPGKLGSRPSGYNAPNRHFSAAAIAQSLVDGTQHFITDLHVVTGTPWFITIPLVALSVNLVARLPMTIYMRRISLRRATLRPLIEAWAHRHAQDLMRQQSTARLDKEVPKLVAKTTNRIYRKFGVQQWKMFSNLTVLPFWLAAIESLRRLCGGPRGLLGNFIFGSKAESPGPSAALAATSTASSAASDPFDVVSVTDNALVEHSITAQLPTAIDSGADATLATGGCLWFPDLTMADPHHVLPFLLSAVLVLNLLPRSTAAIRRLFGLKDGTRRSSTVPVESKTLLRLRRALIGVSCVVGPLTMDLPAALHLYWISSATITAIQSEAIARWMKAPKSQTRPCKGLEKKIILPPQ